MKISAYVRLLIPTVGLLSIGCNWQQPNSSTSKGEAAAYVLPSKLFLTPTARRGPEGEIYIDGSTNLPEGLKLDIEIMSVSHQTLPPGSVAVQNGQFHSPGFMERFPNPHFRADMTNWPEAGNSKYIGVPFSAAEGRVHFTAYFNSADQTPGVLGIIGQGGKNLTGQIFKKTDPDVVDSDKMLDDSQLVQFPPFTAEIEAVNLVERAVLIVQGMGKSSTDVGQNIEYNMATPGFHAGKGWSAKLAGDKTYTVSFDFVTDDKQGEHQALWSADLATRKVNYINMAAKELDAQLLEKAR